MATRLPHALLLGLLLVPALVPLAPSASAECVNGVCAESWRNGAGCDNPDWSEGMTRASASATYAGGVVRAWERCDNDYWTFRNASLHASAFLYPTVAVEYNQYDYSYSDPNGNYRNYRGSELYATAAGQTLTAGARDEKRNTCCELPACWVGATHNGAFVGSRYCTPGVPQPRDTYGDPTFPVLAVVNPAIATATALAGTAAGLVTSTVNGAIATVQNHPAYATARDPDGDGVLTQDEATGRSDPTNGTSRPTSDDDGDGVQNQNEQTRAHAAGVLAHPKTRATAADHAWLHFGAPGATAALVSPTGAALRVTYAPTPGPACPGALPRPVPQVLADCALGPAVAKVAFDGTILAARQADNPSVGVPASAFQVSCTPAPLRPLAPPAGPCLVGAGVDGTWLLAPAQQGPRASVQPKAPGGMLVSVAGKTFADVDPLSGDITTTGNGQNNRDALMPLRLWNWHQQAAGTTYQACSGGLASPCATESPPEENGLFASVFAAA